METAHIYIYGDIGMWQSKDSSDWGEITLANVRDQYESQKEADNITLHIHSPGGFVSEGFAIHDYIRSLGKPVKTIIEGMCYSIATVIALAGDEREMTSNADFMIHNPWGWAGGDSNEVQKYADDLKELETKISNFYAEKTNIDAEEALELMGEETFMAPEDALEKGFITKIATVMKAVAKFNPNNPKKQNKMPNAEATMTPQQAESALDKALNSIKNIFSGQKKAQNKVVQDAAGTEIDFPNLEEDETPSEGDTATVDNSPADGEYTMPDGQVYVFDNGKLTEIKDEDEDEDDEENDDEVNRLQTEVKNLQNSLKEEKKTVKTLRSENKTLNTQMDEQKKTLESVQEEIKNVKKSIGSGFEHDDKNHKPGSGSKDKTRQVWKAKEN